MSSTSRVPHILVIDDTLEILDLLQELLAEEGYRVTTARAPLDLTQVHALAPDAIVQDLVFAGTPEPGWAFLTTVRRDPDLVRVPVVLCTGATPVLRTPVIVDQLGTLGVPVLAKPFDIDDFLAVLTAALETRPKSAPALAPELEHIAP
ncbi:MAG: response regulator [Thermomicrobiales bacterium]